MINLFVYGTCLALGVAAATAYAQAPGAGRYATVNGLRMYYEIHGKGEPLVLIHGGGSTIGTSFGTILPMLAAGFKVIAVELQAHGHTDDRNSPVTFEQDADDVASLMQQLGISNASFFGFSNGGNTAMQIAIRHPGLVNRLVLASTFYKRDGMVPGFFEGLSKATLQDMPLSLREAFLKANPDSGKLLTMFTKDRDRMVRFVDWSDETVRSIRVPTLIVNGDRDVIQASHAAAMAKLIAGSRLLILPATHGEYIGVAEGPHANPNMIALTVSIIKRFLVGE